ncbi:MAG: 2-oxoacid:ferredoxin oxidoreductase subunit beta [Bacteriovoracaceae bacterium]|nr:2-oxoacid:ferredoxin oxidoreductase subunit beta [Bacteriovoracaceae bacterium]
MSEACYTKKDLCSDQEVKWCPGCGDYVILASLQQAMVNTGKKKEDIVCVSGIGCSSRLPYYMDTYGFHTIHGRAPSIASGVKLSNPNLSVWVITGDGDGLSIGGNHFIHAMRRNINMNVILFNNQIYGLTKGQYSPTSEQGKVTKSTPYGSLDRTFRPGTVALGAGCTFLAKALDTDPKGMTEVLTAADQHQGTSFVEVYQNCVIFNDKAHDLYANRASRADTTLMVEHGKPMVFGKDKNKGIILKGLKLEVVELGEQYQESDLLIHDKHNEALAYLLIDASKPPHFPMVLGVLYQENLETYEVQMEKQIEDVKVKKGGGSFKELLYSGETWTVK